MTIASRCYHLSEQSMKCSIVDDEFKFLAIEAKSFVSEGGLGAHHLDERLLEGGWN